MQHPRLEYRVIRRDGWVSHHCPEALKGGVGPLLIASCVVVAIEYYAKLYARRM
jgi:hypothetical protein